MREINFKEWIIKFQNKQTPKGDLARDVKSDKSFPVTSDQQEMLDYLYRKGACEEAKSVFKKAYREFIKCKAKLEAKSNERV
jgi:uncharacterized protein YozE (UPF0346 family)